MNYPILNSGVAVQYPLARRTRHHVVSTRTPGGVVSRIQGGRAPEVGWTLQYENLTNEEAQALEDIFVSTGGGLKSFDFVDPLANLFAWSEDLFAAEWQRSGLSVTKLSESYGDWTGFRLCNESQAEAFHNQVLRLGGGGLICISCAVRGTEGIEVMLVAGSEERKVQLTPAWQRHWVVGEQAAEGASGCGVRLPAGGMVEVACLQAELQRSPTAYKAASGHNGHYATTRFDQKGLQFQAMGPNRNSATVRLVSRRESAA